MLRPALTQMRAHAGRLAAAGVAIVIGTAFVAATLLASGLLEQTVRASVSASYAGAAAVVSDPDGGSGVDEAVLEQVRSAPGVAGAEGTDRAYVTLLGGGRTDYATAGTAPTLPALAGTARTTAGALPSAPGEVAVRADLAAQLGLAVGDPLDVSWYAFPEAADGSADAAAAVERTTTTTVTGIVADRSDLSQGYPQLFAADADVAAWSGDAVDGPRVWDSLLVVGDAGTTPEGVRDAVAAATGASTDPGLTSDGAVSDRPLVLTAEQQADETVAAFTGSRSVLTGALLSFAAVAVFVAGVVVSNTLSVLVAQRTRELALMRCVGATRSQVRRMVLVEAVLLGLTASAAGVVLGIVLAQVAAVVVSRMDLGFDTPGAVSVSPASVVVPIVVGLVTTVLAALAPARAATRVTPLAALRPIEAPPGSRAPRWRVAVTLLLVVGGAALLAGGSAIALATGPGALSLGVAVLGGAVSFTGVLVGAQVLLPPLVRVLSGVVARLGGVPARLAASNSRRNPRRTAVTASALVIGVTLVSLMTVGTASVQRTITAETARTNPADITVTAPGTTDANGVPTGSGALGDGVVGAVVALADGGTLAEVVPVAVAVVEVTGTDPGQVTGGAVTAPAVVSAVSAEASADGSATRVLSPEADAALPGPGEVFLPVSGASWPVLPEGRVTLTGPAGSVEVTARSSPVPGQYALVSPEDLTRIAPDAGVASLWASIGDTPPTEAVTAVQDATATTTTSGVPVQVAGGAVDRDDLEGLLDTVLGVVLALLGVAVVIALVGVSNTLSLSVIERTRESALLRALGLTRGQLRRTLAVEGLLLAAVGALTGVVLGTLYGWAAAVSTFGSALGVQLAFPWQRIALVVAVALLAGLLASVLPARRAAMTPPVAALGE